MLPARACTPRPRPARTRQRNQPFHSCCTLSTPTSVAGWVALSSRAPWQDASHLPCKAACPHFDPRYLSNQAAKCNAVKPRQQPVMLAVQGWRPHVHSPCGWCRAEPAVGHLTIQRLMGWAFGPALPCHLLGAGPCNLSPSLMPLRPACGRDVAPAAARGVAWGGETAGQGVCVLKKCECLGCTTRF